MSDIQFNCPKCKNTISVSKQNLQRPKGRVNCPECGAVCLYTVGKSQPNKEAPEAKQQESVVRYRVPKYQLPKPTPIYREPKYFLSSVDKDKLFKTQRQKQPEKLFHQQPEKPVFAEVGVEPLTFNLLDEQAKHLPQVAADSAVETLPIVLRDSAHEQQNNFTIRTDNLVFTLVNADAAKQNALGTLVNTDDSSVQSSQETNWMMANIVALIILMVQLFYFVLMII